MAWYACSKDLWAYLAGSRQNTHRNTQKVKLAQVSQGKVHKCLSQVPVPNALAEICMWSPTMLHLHDSNCWIRFRSVTHWLSLCCNTFSVQSFGCPTWLSFMAKHTTTLYVHVQWDPMPFLAFFFARYSLKCCVLWHRYILYTFGQSLQNHFSIFVYVHYCMLIPSVNAVSQLTFYLNVIGYLECHSNSLFVWTWGHRPCWTRLQQHNMESI